MASLLVLAAIALPTINLAHNCQAEQKAIPPNPEHTSVYESCMKDEEAAHEALLKRWPRVPASVRATCAEMGRLVGSYVEVEVCVDIDSGNLSANSQEPVIQHRPAK